MHVTRVLGLVVLLGSIQACGPPHEYIEGDDPEFPRLRFDDGSVSVNDRCPVTLSRLNRKLDPLYVNGRSVGFC